MTITILTIFYVENSIMVKKLESLTPEQEALIPVVRDRWKNQLTAEPNYEEIEKGISGFMALLI